MTDRNDESRLARSATVSEWYESNRGALAELLKRLESEIREVARERVPQAKAVVDGRVKIKDSLVKKALRPAQDKKGSFKYAEPLEEVHDIVALRITVPMTQELYKLKALLLESRWDWHEELEDHGKNDASDQTRPGYRSTHGVLNVEEFGGPVKRVEVQLRTILQHAWAELSHDLLYKEDAIGRPDLERRLHAVAGMLELADRELLEIRAAQLGLEAIVGEVEPQLLRLLATHLFSADKDDPTDSVWYERLAVRIRALGINDMSKVQQTLGDALMKEALDLKPSLKIDFFWTNPAFMLDVWFSEALPDERRASSQYDYAYFMSKAPHTPEDADA